MFPQPLQLVWIFLMALYTGSHHSILPCQGGEKWVQVIWWVVRVTRDYDVSVPTTHIRNLLTCRGLRGLGNSALFCLFPFPV